MVDTKTGSVDQEIHEHRWVPLTKLDAYGCYDCHTGYHEWAAVRIATLQAQLVAQNAVISDARKAVAPSGNPVERMRASNALRDSLARLDAADVPVVLGPGDAQQLRDILCQASTECRQKDCEHCRIAGLLLGRMTGPLLDAAGPGHVACAKHGIQLSGHTCDWGSTYTIEDR